jgi:predicted RNA-binding Zn-ribbon protein involved in translation (DUF1610 family)
MRSTASGWSEVSPDGEWGMPPPPESVRTGPSERCLVRLAGHPPREGTVALRYRPRRNRLIRGLVLLLLWPPACLVAAFIPPHGEPLAVAFFGGMYLIYRALTTAYVVESLQAECPRCGEALVLKRNARMKESREVVCYACHFHPHLDLPER